MRFLRSVLHCAVVSLTLACGDSSGPGASTPANVILVSGDAQPTPEVGTKLAAPLVVRVTDAQGNNRAGVSVAWSTVSGSLSAESSITDATGSASVEWTLGTAVGTQTATATVTGLKPVTFTAAAVPGAVTQILVTRDTVELLGIGDFFRFNARAADQFGNVVIGQITTVESDDPSAVTADNFGSGAILTAHASNKTIGLRASLGPIVRTATVIVLPPPCGSGSMSSDLAVGQMVVLAGAAASEFCVQGTASGAEFIAIPYFSDFHGTLLRLSISTGNTTIEAFSNRGISPGFQRVMASRATPTRDESFERELRERSIRELTPMMPAARLAMQRPEVLRRTTALPVIGDILKLNTNSTNACSSPSTRTGRVVAITDRAIVVADTANPPNGFTTADYREFGITFDTLVYPVDTANFGAPTDVDKNQRVMLFFTRAVNELTPPGVSYYVGGFYFTRDLYPVQPTASLAGCTTSNFAEMFYLLVPDPAGAINQNTRSVDFVKTVTVSTLAHEFQHLINASRRLYVTTSNSFEDVFLDEGLSHEAEELAFYRASGLSPGQNIDYQQIQASPKVQTAFDNFGAPNVRRLIEYLTNPPGNSPYVNNGNITTRGAIWSFLRYAADRKGGNESQMWFQLANPPADVHGIANITRAVTDDLSGWVRDWAIANYADDLVPNLQPIVTHPSWNMRSVAEAVNQGFWPLDTQQLDVTNITPVGITDGGAAYLRFGVRPGSVGGGRITARGATVPPAFTLSILRTK